MSDSAAWKRNALVLWHHYEIGFVVKLISAALIVLVVASHV